ncbi:MAG: class I SAM-dependent methyltransferase [Leptospiraceae bacterium]|nr:class I SAM-dependent methyltransferase [Leptospiraceae bacterium]
MEIERIRFDKIKEIISNFQSQIEVPDSVFDSVIYPEEIQELSKTHWTPIKVAIEASKMLVTHPNTRVLDVGSGCGKFCFVASLSGFGFFLGIEIRLYLHEIAMRKKEILNMENVEFLLGDMTDLDWSKFDAFYLYNPFYENITNYNHIDKSIPLNRNYFKRYTSIVTAQLRKCKTNTRVVTYHGFGGDMPDDYFCQETKKIGSGELNLWIKS